ncbi:hypothetical protein [Sorangium sp. So ce131]|uniref:hypothetical protein n=1 Tax=Sorangium sp. So ce131 TaxID=3133282 RepID=UPI003F5F7216
MRCGAWSLTWVALAVAGCAAPVIVDGVAGGECPQDEPVDEPGQSCWDWEPYCDMPDMCPCGWGVIDCKVPEQALEAGCTWAPQQGLPCPERQTTTNLFCCPG